MEKRSLIASVKRRPERKVVGLTGVCLNDMIHIGFGLYKESSPYFADVAELADAPDLGSGVHDVQVQVLLTAFFEKGLSQN